MSVSFYIAKRYLFARKKYNAINIISLIGVLGVALSTISLVCILAVFSGFKEVVEKLFTSFDAQLTIVPTKEKYFDSFDIKLKKISDNKNVEVFSKVFSSQALLEYKGRQCLITLKGVDGSYNKVCGIDSLLYGNGKYLLQADVLNYGILGISVANKLGIGTSFPDALKVYAPRKDEKIDISNPLASFNVDELYSPGVVFEVNQQKYDDNIVIAPLSFVSNLFEKTQKITAVELKLKSGTDEYKEKRDIQSFLGENYRVLDRYELHKEAYQTMNIEKMIAYLFLILIMIVACFNIIGSLSMLIIEKKENIRTLIHLGMNRQTIIKIFQFEGGLVIFLGASIGLLLGMLLCWIQIEYGILKLGETSGNFIVDTYPVSIQIVDILMVCVAVIIVALSITLYPVRKLVQKVL